MTARQVAALFLRLVAIYVIITSTIPSLLSIATAITSIKAVGTHLAVSELIAAASSGLIVLGLMLFIMVRSHSLAQRVVKEDFQSITLEKISSQELQALAFSLVGILVLVTGISGLVHDLTYLHRLSKEAGQFNSMVRYPDNFYSGIAGTTIQIIFGLCLFLYPSGLARLWHSIQRTRNMKAS